MEWRKEAGYTAPLSSIVYTLLHPRCYLHASVSPRWFTRFNDLVQTNTPLLVLKILLRPLLNALDV